MRIQLLTATLLLCACLPTTAQGQTGSAATPMKTVATVATASTADGDQAALCNAMFSSLPASSTEVSVEGFGETFLVANGGRCTSNFVCASKICIGGICRQTP